VRSHGVFRLMQYSESIAAGEINPRPQMKVSRESGAVTVIDADGGYGYRPALEGMTIAVKTAKQMGLGCVSVRNSHHFGMAAAFPLKAAAAGSIGFVTTNSLPQIAPPGASEAVVGNNPFAIAVPRPGRRPIVVDIALTDAAFGTAAMASLAGTELAPGLALDSRGRPTTDPESAMRSGILVAIGKQKGYGLSVAAEVLSAALSGSPIGKDSNCHRMASGGVGHFLLAIEPSFFIDRRTFSTLVEVLCSQIKHSAPAEPGAEIHVPGEIGWRTYEKRIRDGIPLPSALYEELGLLAQSLDVLPLKVCNET
jgi:LDH2 family malate/lactate/ureidoglycolate dehydrogenase